MCLQVFTLVPKMGRPRFTRNFNKIQVVLVKINPDISCKILEEAKATLSFIILSCEEKSYDRVVSVGQVAFEWRLYCGHRRPMQSSC